MFSVMFVCCIRLMPSSAATSQPVTSQSVTSQPVSSEPATAAVDAFRSQRQSDVQMLASMACYTLSNIIYKAHAQWLTEIPWCSYLYYIHHVSLFGIYLSLNSEFRNDIKRVVKSLRNKHRPSCV